MIAVQPVLTVALQSTLCVTLKHNSWARAYCISATIATVSTIEYVFLMVIDCYARLVRSQRRNIEGGKGMIFFESHLLAIHLVNVGISFLQYDCLRRMPDAVS